MEQSGSSSVSYTGGRGFESLSRTQDLEEEHYLQVMYSTRQNAIMAAVAVAAMIIAGTVLT